MSATLIEQRILANDRNYRIDLNNGEAVVIVSGNHLYLTVIASGKTWHEEVTVYNNPFYDTFERFCRNAGDRLRVGIYNVSNMRIVAIYDSRDAFYPSLDDVMEEKREATREAMERDDELSENGLLVEWEQGNNFGWFWNLDEPAFCEWGIASMFPVGDESFDQMRDRQQRNHERLLELLGGKDKVVVIDTPPITLVQSPPSSRSQA